MFDPPGADDAPGLISRVLDHLFVTMAEQDPNTCVRRKGEAVRWPAMSSWQTTRTRQTSTKQAATFPKAEAEWSHASARERILRGTRRLERSVRMPRNCQPKRLGARRMLAACRWFEWGMGR